MMPDASFQSELTSVRRQREAYRDSSGSAKHTENNQRQREAYREHNPPVNRKGEGNDLHMLTNWPPAAHEHTGATASTSRRRREHATLNMQRTSLLRLVCMHASRYNVCVALAPG